MALTKKTSVSSSPTWEVKLRAKIDELRRLEQKAFGPRHGKTDSYNYLKAVYRFCDWSDPKVSQPVGQRDLLPNLPSFIRRVCSGYAPDRGVLRTQSV